VEREKQDAEAGLADASTRSAADEWRSFEVTGVFGLWRWDPAAQLLTIGPEACNLVGANHDGAMTLDEFASVVNEDARRRVRDALEAPGGSQQISVTFQGVGRAAGRHFELMGGVSDGIFSGAILNVTDRVQAHLVSRRAEALARTALDAHPGPVALWDSRKRLTHWNAAFARVFNLDKDVAQTGASYDLVMAELAKFVRVERLGHVVHGPELEPAHDVAGVGFRREEDDRNIAPRRYGLDALAGLEPVHFRHHHVQQDQVGPDLLENLQGLPAVGGDVQQVPVSAQDCG
jgi:PAS domain-containing protein